MGHAFLKDTDTEWTQEVSVKKWTLFADAIFFAAKRYLKLKLKKLLILLINLFCVSFKGVL